MVFINYIEKHLLLVEIMDDYLNKLFQINKINENSIEIEKLREMIEVSNMKLNELKTVVRHQDYLINKCLNKPYYDKNEYELNYYGLYAINFIYLCFFVYIINKL